MKTKAELRAAAVAARSSLSARARGDASAKISMRIAQTSIFLRAKTIAVYSAVKAEADPRDLVVIAERVRKKLAFPRVRGSRLEFVLATPAQLTAEGPFSIPEAPLSLPAVELGAIDLFVVPGVCFSRKGERIGYGKGYYDAALAAARVENFKVATIGFAFEAQIFEEVPVEAHDVRLDGVATENTLTTSRSELL